MEDLKFKLIRQFGPSVFKVKIPKKMVDDLNNYIDDIIENPEIIIPDNLLEFLAQRIDSNIRVV